MNLMPRSILVLPLLALYAAIALAAPNFHEGLWEITTTVQVIGLPTQLQVEPQHETHCFTQADIEHPENIIPPKVNCTMQDISVSGDRVQWQLQCSGPLAAQGSGETIYNGDTFTGKAHLFNHANDMVVEIMTSYQGRRIGDCK